MKKKNKYSWSKTICRWVILSAISLSLTVYSADAKLNRSNIAGIVKRNPSLFEQAIAMTQAPMPMQFDALLHSEKPQRAQKGTTVCIFAQALTISEMDALDWIIRNMSSSFGEVFIYWVLNKHIRHMTLPRGFNTRNINMRFDVNGKLAKQHGVTNLPTVVLIDGAKSTQIPLLIAPNYLHRALTTP